MSGHPTHLLSAFLDSELSDAELGDLTTHLADCVDCRADLDSLAAVRSQIRALPMIEPASGVIDKKPVPIVPRWRRTLIGAGAAAALVLVVGVGVGNSGRGVVPLQLDQVVGQHVARASVDPGFNVIQVQAVTNR